MTTNQYDDDEDLDDDRAYQYDVERWDELSTPNGLGCDLVDESERLELVALAARYGWTLPTFTPANPPLHVGPAGYTGPWWHSTGGSRT